jgi:hypothetical protein
VEVNFALFVCYDIVIDESFRESNKQILDKTNFTASQGHYGFFTVFRLLTDFVYLYTYEFWLSLCKIVRSSVINKQILDKTNFTVITMTQIIPDEQKKVPPWKLSTNWRKWLVNKGNNKITELRTILQRESQNS